jgi:hypothetical protein
MDEITLEQDVDEILGPPEAVEGDVMSAPADSSPLDPDDDGPEESEEEGSDGDDGET